jgi:hypothetical protein
MGRVCHVCHQERAHERFGGRGYRAQVCDRCRRLPKIQQQSVLFTDELLGFLEQKNISAKNIARLKEIESFEVPEIARKAAVLRKIALVHPRTNKRWGFLRLRHPDLYRDAIDVGFISPEDDDDFSSDDPWFEHGTMLALCDEQSAGRLSLDEVNQLLLELTHEEPM